MTWNQETAEACARVAGLALLGLTWSETTATLTDYEGFWFDPRNDDGDSRRLEAACMKWVKSYEAILADKGLGNYEPIHLALFRALSAHRFAYDTGDLQAIRDAVIALAVAIDAAGRE